jgi:hypothetical protein
MLERVDNNCAGIRRQIAPLEKWERVTSVWKIKLCQLNRNVGCNFRREEMGAWVEDIILTLRIELPISRTIYHPGD